MKHYTQAEKDKLFDAANKKGVFISVNMGKGVYVNFKAQIRGRLLKYPVIVSNSESPYYHCIISWQAVENLVNGVTTSILYN